jgi:hypothetical protein
METTSGEGKKICGLQSSLFTRLIETKLILIHSLSRIYPMASLMGKSKVSTGIDLSEICSLSNNFMNLSSQKDEKKNSWQQATY